MVGRDPSCEIVVTDGSVSRRHARLERRGVAWWVVDQGSANGTYVNSQRIAEQALKTGQELRFGALAFRVELVEDPEATVATPILDEDGRGHADGRGAGRLPPPAAPKPAAPPPLPRPRRRSRRCRPSRPCRRCAATPPPAAVRPRRRRRAPAGPPPRRCRRCRPARAPAKKGRSPDLLDRHRLLRLPPARRAARRRHRRRRVHGHAPGRQRRPDVARRGADEPDGRGGGRAQQRVPRPARRAGDAGGGRRRPALEGRHLRAALDRERPRGR